MKAWWDKGVQFECQGSAKCCISRGQYGHVYLTRSDRKALAELFGMSTRAFSKEYCIKKELDIWQLKGFEEACVFLKNNKCTVYKARPTQCRTWPFWPENMSPKAWSKEVKSFCPGVGKGKTWTAEEIKKQLASQAKSEEQYWSS